MLTTAGRGHKPTFDSRAEFIVARPMKWGSNDVGYVDLPAGPDLIDLSTLNPPCSEDIAARLYRTGYLAMVLQPNGEPKLRESAPTVEAETEPEPEIVGATCPKCGRQFKSRHVPHFHTVQCSKAAR